MSATTLATPKSPALYARISKKEKQAGKEHLWVERQEGDGRALGETISWPEPTLYVDDGHSAWSGARRPGYEQMVTDIKAGKIDGILIGAAFDRLSRSTIEMLPVFKFLKDHKIRLWSAWEGDLDLTTADGWKHAIDIVSAAEHSSSRTSERTRRTKQQRAEMGTFSGGRPPFGFCADGVTHHPTEAPLIRRAAREIVEGRSLNSIAVETGVSRRTLHRAMLSARVRGVRVHRGAEFGKAGWDPILEPELQRQVAVVLSDPKRHSGSKQRSYLLAGVIFTDDGRKMVSNPDHRPDGVVLRRYKALEGSPGVSVSADPLERLVAETIFDERLAERELHDDVGPADDSAAVEAEIAACHAELVHLRELRRALPEPLIERDDYLFEKGLVDKRLAAAEAKRPAPAPYVEPELTDLSAAELRARWFAEDETQLSFDQRRGIILRHVERVIVAPAVKRGRGLDTERVLIKWRPA